MIYETAPFSMTLNDRYPGVKLMPFFDVEWNMSEMVQDADIVAMKY